MHKTTPVEALKLLLDQVDYIKGACGPTELVAAVLSTDIISICRQALTDSGPVEG